MGSRREQGGDDGGENGDAKCDRQCDEGVPHGDRGTGGAGEAHRQRAGEHAGDQPDADDLDQDGGGEPPGGPAEAGEDGQFAAPTPEKNAPEKK